MKKLIALLLTVALLLLATSALAYDKDNPITIQLWHTRGSGANYEVLKDSVDKFNATVGAEKGIIVEEVYQGSYAQNVSKLQLASQSNELPVVAVCAGDYISTLMDDGLLADLAPFAAATGFDFSNIFESLFNVPGNEDGQIHSIAYIKSTPVLYYNKTMADAKGLKAPRTIAELEEFGKALYEVDPATGEVITYGFEMYNNISYVQGAFLAQLGEPFLSPDGTAPCLNSALLRVYTDWDRWLSEGWCRAFESTSATTKEQELFYQGKLASFLVSCGSMGNIVKHSAEAGIELGVAPFPTYDIEKPISIIGGGELCLISGNNTQEQQEAGWEFIQFVLSDDMIADNTIRTGYIPITKSIAENETMKKFWEEHPEYKVAYDQLPTAIPESYPYFEHREEFRVNVQGISSQLVQERSLTPEQAVEQIKADNAHLFE